MKFYILKDNKFLRKVIASSISIAISMGSSMAFVGCKEEINSSQPSYSTSVNDSSFDSSSSVVEPEIPDSSSSSSKEDIDVVPETSISFDEFMTSSSQTALDFAYTYFKNDLLDNKTPLSQTWGFHANGNDELDSLSLTYLYQGEENTRILEVANATLIEPLDLDKVLSGKFEAKDTAKIITRETAFEFDAKENYLNSDISQVLFDKVEKEGVKYFAEIESVNEGMRSFQVAVENEKAIEVYSIEVEGNTDQEILESFETEFRWEMTHYATYPLGDKESKTISTQKYQIEEFAPENVDELVNDYNDELMDAFNTYFLEKAGKKTIGNSFDANKMTYSSWDVGQGEEISEIKFITEYAKYEDTYLFCVGKIELQAPIAVSSLTKNKINSIIEESAENARYSRDYYFSYNPAIQGTRTELVNAIFEAYGMGNDCPEGAIRKFNWEGSFIDDDLGETQKFTLIQIAENETKNIKVIVKSNRNDDERLIENLKNPENMKVLEEDSCTHSGKKVKQSNNNNGAQDPENENPTDYNSENENFKY